MNDKTQSKGNLKYFIIILAIIGGSMLLGGFIVGKYFPEPVDNTNITCFGGIPYDETETGKILTNPSVLINDGAETTNGLMVLLIINCGNASEMKIKTGAVTPWNNWESYQTMKTITLGEPNPYFPIYTVSIQFRKGNYTSIIVSDIIKYTGDNPEYIDSITYNIGLDGGGSLLNTQTDDGNYQQVNSGKVGTGNYQINIFFIIDPDYTGRDFYFSFHSVSGGWGGKLYINDVLYGIEAYTHDFDNALIEDVTSIKYTSRSFYYDFYSRFYFFKLEEVV